MCMWRVSKSLPLVAAIALSLPLTMQAQRGGHASGGGGHVGGFSGGGSMGARGFGGSFSGSAPRSFQAPPVNFYSGQTRLAPSTRPYSFTAPRSAFGQLNTPVNRGAYPGVANNKNWNGHYPYRPPYRNGYRYGYPVYANLYATPWFGAWPYFGNWSDFSDTSEPVASVAPDQSYAPEQEPQYDEGRPAYQPGYQPGYAPAAEPSPEPALTIIYKDGHSRQVHNYALTPTKLLLLDEASSGRTQQVSLDEINIAATRQANLSSGIDFSPPIRN
jgi:hypothetical protein